MKPTKNRIFCLGCKHTKMLFESKRKADNFIRYNSEEILEENGKAPVRSYYCKFCGGFHVTSKTSVDEEVLNDAEQRKLEEQKKKEEKKQRRKEKKIRSQLQQQELKAIIDEITTYISYGEIQYAESLISEAYQKFEEIKKENSHLNLDFKYLLNCLEVTVNVKNKIKLLMDKSEEERRIYCEEEEKKITVGSEGSSSIIQYLKSERRIIIEAFEKISILKQIEYNISLIEKHIGIFSEEHISNLIDFCSETFKVISDNQNNLIIKRLQNKILLLQNRTMQSNNNKDIDTNNETSNPIDNKKEKKLNSRKNRLIIFPTVNRRIYFKSIKEIVNRLDNILELYNNGNIESCKDEFEIVQYLLDDLKKNDEHTVFIKEFLIAWKEVLY